MAYVVKHDGGWNICGLCKFPTRDDGQTEDCQNPACAASRGDYDSYARLWAGTDAKYAERAARKQEQRLRSWSFRSSSTLYVATPEELAFLVG